MSWITRILHLDGERDRLTDETIEEQLHRSEIAKRQAHQLHEDVVVPLARQARESLARNNYGEALSRAYKPPRPKEV